MAGVTRQNDTRAFLRLPENRLAVAAVKKLAPGERRRSVSFVTIVGPPGSGKSHLVRQLISGWEAQRTSQKLIVVTASQFAAQLAEASATKTIPQFQRRYRHDVALFVCEDIQMLGSRHETQQQLEAALDDILDGGGLVLFTSTHMPGAIRGLRSRLVNRIHGSLCAAIRLPGLESRRKLVVQYLNTKSLRLSSEEIDLMIRDENLSPRDLLGTLNQLCAEAALRGKGAARKRGDLSSLVSDRQKKSEIPIADIANATAARFGVKLADMKSPKRSQTVSLARQTAMYLARELSQMNYADIGKFFNRGNHSTVIHACRKIAEERDANSTLDREIRRIREELKTP